jgi:protein phosphatase
MFFLKTKRRKFARIPDDRLHIRAIVRTDAGCVRRNNEDNAGFRFIGGSKTQFVAFLADGMGGYEYGEIASGIMAETVCDDGGQTLSNHPRRWLSKMFQQANSRIYKYALQHETVMGTTCSMLLIQDKKVLCAHAGDSRIYLLTDSGFGQLTCDHTVVGEMMRRSRLTTEEARIHPQRSILTKALGTGRHIEPDIFRITCPVRAGDRFLLCSDGLHDLVSDSDIRRLLTLPSLKTAAESLVNAAKERGGYDNITVVIVEINEKTKNNESSDI